jgi:VWFA-related protein
LKSQPRFTQAVACLEDSSVRSDESARFCSIHRLALGTLLLFFLVPGSARSQAPQNSAELREVTVYATVRDKHGKIVPNLTKDDFELKEDGRPQGIRYFARESSLPLTLGLVVDTNSSQRRMLDQERAASYSFLDQILRAGKDRAFLIHFDREVELLQDLTSSRQKLQSALALLQTPESPEMRRDNREGRPGDDGVGSGQNPRHGQRRGSTLLYDAIYLASNDMMKKETGRKALLVLSDGVDIGSHENLGQAIEAAQRANTIVYTILLTDAQGYDHNRGFSGGGIGRRGGVGGPFPGRIPRAQRPDGKKVLDRVATETGGQLFQVSKKLPVDAIYAQIGEELRNEYSVAYTPDRTDPGPGYHTIQLTTKKRGLIVQARGGYYSDR